MKDGTFDFGKALEGEMGALRSFGVKLCGNATLADDLVQDTLLAALAHPEQFREGTDLRAWLITILRNKYFSLYRKRRREVEDPIGTYARRQATPAYQESRMEFLDFWKMFAQLSREHREVLMLIGVHERTYEEAASVLGVAVGTVKSRLIYARMRIRLLLSGESVVQHMR